MTTTDTLQAETAITSTHYRNKHRKVTREIVSQRYYLLAERGFTRAQVMDIAATDWEAYISDEAMVWQRIWAESVMSERSAA